MHLLRHTLLTGFLLSVLLNGALAQEKIPSIPHGEGKIAFDFEKGGLQGWRIVEGTVGHPVAANKSTRNSDLPMNQEGKYYLGTLEAKAGGPPLDGQLAVIESPVFKLTNAAIKLAVSGGQSQETYVALCTLDGNEVKKVHGKDSEFFSANSWNVPDLVGKPVYFRLVDRSRGAWGHIVVDAISAQGTLLPDETKKRFANIPAQPVPPAERKANSPEQELATFKLADGFVAELVASEEQGLINPIDLTFDDAGRLWTQTARMYPLDPVTGIHFGQAMSMMKDQALMAKNPRFNAVKRLYEMKDKGTDEILIVEDPTKTATEPLMVFAKGLTIPQSILPYKDGVYVAHGSELLYLNDTDGDGVSDAMEPVLSGFGFFDTHTMSHTLVRGPGGWVNFSHGLINSGDVTVVATGETTKIELCLTARFSTDGKHLEVVNRGLQNIWGYQLRGNGQWYGTEANDVGYSVVPMESQTAYQGVQGPKIRPYQTVMPPLHSFRVGGTGISGLAFSDDEGDVGYPSEWENVAFLANPITNSINAVRVNRNSDGTVEGEHLPDLLKSTDSWFRPVNIEFGPDGCLYVADWYNKIVSHNEVDTAHPDRDKTHGRIWRIRHESQKPREVPNLIEADSGDLVSHLSSPYLWEKRAAWHQLVDRQAKDQIPALQKLVTDDNATVPTRIHALWALEGLGGFERELFAALISNSTDADLRREAIRSLASFDIPPADVADLVAEQLENENVMVRSQVLRTLAEIGKADPAVIALLVRASKPDIAGNGLGGAYERKFERFLARKALEQYVPELREYLASEAASTHPASNLSWASQVLPAPELESTFLKLWSKVSNQPIDQETFVAIVSMLGSPAVANTVRPTFEDPANGEYLLELAIHTIDRAQSPKVAEFLSATMDRLLASADPKEVRLGLSGVYALRSSRQFDKVAALIKPGLSPDVLKQVLQVLGLAKNVDPSVYQTVLSNSDLDFDIRLEALAGLIKVDTKQGSNALDDMTFYADENQRKLIVSKLSQFPGGILPLLDQWEKRRLRVEQWNFSAAEASVKSQGKDWRSHRIYADVKQLEAASKAQVHQRIETYLAAAKTLKGDPVQGEITFSACLACHAVGDQGMKIAPALDGSANRDLEHLLTAIVDPDAAVEGSYGLFRVTRKDGSSAEGLLVNRGVQGTAIAMMGGAEIFIPRAEIGSQDFVGGRSFMPPVFGELPDQTMIDLITYIKTLK